MWSEQRVGMPTAAVWSSSTASGSDLIFHSGLLLTEFSAARGSSM
jgi:hypothetical protein